MFCLYIYLPEHETFGWLSVDKLPEITQVVAQGEEDRQQGEDNIAHHEDGHGPADILPQWGESVEDKREAAAPGILPHEWLCKQDF